MSNDGLVAQTREDLHRAIQAHLNALSGPGVLTDWIVIGECMDDESDDLMLHLGLSESITAWKLKGMIHTVVKQVYEIPG